MIISTDSITNYLNITEMNLIYDYYLIDYDEKKNFDKNYFNIANIVKLDINKVNINTLVDDNLSQQYEYNLQYNYNDPLTELFIIIQFQILIIFIILLKIR